ncbi:unnamed protein product [Acanthoscelides obtectus]|uniref:Uncharacterized protein n=1 Tax=Acanthoscelides obtectus TaxID=200917 RepID=A0A9P0KUK3_ACAOB|nr:unnamed protein product [Acanthoscelides obtectus]CAK1643477.1 hypothetical protein AOBTE_LOCUS13543 [Acanthoscelides obtectus]
MTGMLNGWRGTDGGRGKKYSLNFVRDIATYGVLPG